MITLITMLWKTDCPILRRQMLSLYLGNLAVKAAILRLEFHYVILNLWIYYKYFRIELRVWMYNFIHRRK